MANEFVQTMSDARVDAQSLSDFVFKPSGFKVPRRLAPPIDTLQFYIDRFDATKATTDAYIATIPSIVNNAINNTAVEGGVLADTFLVVGGVVNQRQVNAGIESISDLLAIHAPTEGLRLHVKSRFAGEGVGGGDFIFSTLSAETDNGGTVFNATGGKWLRVFSGAHKVSWYAGSDSATEDRTALVQKAIDATCRLISADALEVDGKYKITSSLMIDRMVDQTKGDYVIYATGGDKGFLVDTSVTMFSSRAPHLPAGSGYTRHPVSEFTIFRNVDFECTDEYLESYVFDDKYLRLTFEGCTHRKIRGCKEGAYLQSIKWINHCKFRQHRGYFVESVDAYDISLQQAEFENSGRGFKFTGIIRSGHFDYNLYQGCDSPFINAHGFFGGSIDRNYFEQNTDAEIVLGEGGGVSSGFTVDNNIWLLGVALSAEPFFYPVQVGTARGFTLIGNASNGNIAQTEFASLFEMTVVGNAVPPNRRAASHDADILEEVTPVDTSILEEARALRRHYNIIMTDVGVHPSVRLPKLANYSNGSQITVINNSNVSLNVYPATGERISGVAYSEPDVFGGFGNKSTYLKSGSDYWVKI